VKRPSRDQYQSAAALRVGLRQFLSRTEQVTRSYGLTPERYELLLLIKTSPDGEATVGTLGQRLCIGQSATTQLVRRAEDLGLIERTMSRRDARVHPLRLTDEGERRLAGALLALSKERSALASALVPVLAVLQPEMGSAAEVGARDA
jgi:DNA-binding MarR family transcriptional regulator